MQDILGQVTGAASETVKTFDIGQILRSNQLAQGGLVIGAIGFVLAFCRSLPERIYIFVRKGIVLTVEVESQGSSFYKNRVLRNISKYKRNFFNHQLETDFQYSESDGDYKTGLRVGIGSFYGKENFWFKINRVRNSDKMQLTEFLYIETFIWNRKKLISLINTCMNTSDKVNNIYVSDGGDWSQKNLFRGKSWHDIILMPGVKEKIIQDISQFKEDRRWYADRSAPHQRGYCLHGSPGTGKTSISAAIATTLDKGLYILHLTKLLTDQNLADLFSNVDGVLLIEDIDGILNKRDILLEGPSWTFSGLLNAINGANPDLKTRVIIMTSNHPENLDPALIRPGRIDQIIHIGCVGAQQAVELFRVFHGDQLTDIERDIYAVVGDKLVQPVILREVYINQKRDVDKIPEALKLAIGTNSREWIPVNKITPADENHQYPIYSEEDGIKAVARYTEAKTRKKDDNVMQQVLPPNKTYEPKHSLEEKDHEME